MIPKNISKDHILKALADIDSADIPVKRKSTRYDFVYGDRTYPPKYVLSIANKYANGGELNTKTFNGGEQESNKFLSNLGFEIRPKSIYPIREYSWEVLSPHLAIKTMDKSCFLYHGSGIPIKIRPFFNVSMTTLENRHEVNLEYKGQVYGAWVSFDNQEMHRTRLFWQVDLRDTINQELAPWNEAYKKGIEVSETDPKMRFLRDQSNPDLFHIELVSIRLIEEDIKSELFEENGLSKEGGIKPYYGKRYERDPKNRALAIAIHGLKCSACGFNFEKIYGERGKGFIEVHHLKPLFSLQEEILVDPKEDLTTVCSNCHRMIHRRKDCVLSVEEVKAIIKDERNTPHN